MSDLYTLKEYYVRYLKNVRCVKDSTVAHYVDALNNITRHLVKKGLVENSIFEISEIGDLEIIRTYLKSDKEFLELDKRGHQMYSSGMNNYYKFASGKGFKDIHKEIELLDLEVPIGKLENREVKEWHRSTIIKTQAIETCSYECEINIQHYTFTAKSTGHQYMEGHHAIAMKNQPRFDKSLDVYANVICLCPTCHRLLHYGVDADKKILIKQIYDGRADRLARSGIRLSENEFEKIVI